MKDLKLTPFQQAKRWACRKLKRQVEASTPAKAWRSSRNETIAYLARQDPEAWDVPTLAYVFELDPSTVRKILKSLDPKWRDRRAS